MIVSFVGSIVRTFKYEFTVNGSTVKIEILNMNARARARSSSDTVILDDSSLRIGSWVVTHHHRVRIVRCVWYAVCPATRATTQRHSDTEHTLDNNNNDSTPSILPSLNDCAARALSCTIHTGSYVEFIFRSVSGVFFFFFSIFPNVLMLVFK